MVCVHFFNQKESKPNLIAFLNRDMSWDLREIVSEVSILYDDKEVITVEHKALETQKKDSDFDKLIRSSLIESAKRTHGEDADLEKEDFMFSILNNGYKHDN
ncbi:MAG: hypothetical protein WC523_04845 [Patescibacteria group bacterium]